MAGAFDIELSTAGVPIDALIASMCKSARRVRLADRAALYAQGEPANALFLILDGFVKTSRICEDGTEITIELLKYGDIAGAIPARQLQSEHEETAQAIGDVVVQRVLAHELHHVVRGRGPGFGRSLGETMVSEGLAQCFEEEVGAPTPFYAVFLDSPALAKASAKARDTASSLHHDYNAWFFGRPGDPEWPRYAGYSLGYAIVKAWLDENDATAAESATVPANDIIGPWLGDARDIIVHPTR